MAVREEQTARLKVTIGRFSNIVLLDVSKLFERCVELLLSTAKTRLTRLAQCGRSPQLLM